MGVGTKPQKGVDFTWEDHVQRGKSNVILCTILLTCDVGICTVVPSPVDITDGLVPNTYRVRKLIPGNDISFTT